MLVGYTRVSTMDQTPQLQIDALQPPHHYPSPISDEEFAAIYNAAGLPSAAKRGPSGRGWSRYDTLTRANELRRRGVALARLPNRQPTRNRARFIEVWNAANSPAEAAAALGMSRKVVRSLAVRYRALGEPLKEFRGT